MTDPTQFVCGNCRHVHQTGGGLECWRHPPRAIGIPIGQSGAVMGPGGGVSAGSIKWLVKAVRPPARAGETCGDYEPKPELVN